MFFLRVNIMENCFHNFFLPSSWIYSKSTEIAIWEKDRDDDVLVSLVNNDQSRMSKEEKMKQGNRDYKKLIENIDFWPL